MSDGPCVGCGETNHTAHHVSICAACLRAAKAGRGRGGEAEGEGGAEGGSPYSVQLSRVEMAAALHLLTVAQESGRVRAVDAVCQKLVNALATMPASTLCAGP